MKCDKCNQEIEGVYVGPGDEVRWSDGTHGVVKCGYISNKPDVVAVSWDECRPVFENPSDLRTPDGRPVLGFKDPRDERIKELERVVEHHKRAAYDSLCAWMTLAPASDNDKINEMQKRIKELEAELRGRVKLDDEAIEKIRKSMLKHAGYISHSMLEDGVVKALRDFRDGMPELLPCPFCGDDAVLGKGLDEAHWMVMCVECDAEVETWRKEDAIANWNRRADLVPKVDAKVLADRIIDELLYDIRDHDQGGYEGCACKWEFSEDEIKASLLSLLTEHLKDKE